MEQGPAHGGVDTPARLELLAAKVIRRTQLSTHFLFVGSQSDDPHNPPKVMIRITQSESYESKL